jgi:hypothetical protein
MAENGGCGVKHLKLALWLVGLMVGMFATSLGYALGRASTGDMQAIEGRVRAVEGENGRSDERLKRIEDDVKWVRTKLEGSHQ